MHAIPTPEGRLLVADPSPDTRCDLGNMRLFATLNGAGDVTLFRLPEGIAVLSR